MSSANINKLWYWQLFCNTVQTDSWSTRKNVTNKTGPWNLRHWEISVISLLTFFLHWWAESTVLWTSESAKRQAVSKTHLGNYITKKILKLSTEHVANTPKNVELLLKEKMVTKYPAIKFSHKERPNPVHREIKAIQADLELSLRTGHAHDPN